MSTFSHACPNDRTSYDLWWSGDRPPTVVEYGLYKARGPRCNVLCYVYRYGMSMALSFWFLGVVPGMWKAMGVLDSVPVVHNMSKAVPPCRGLLDSVPVVHNMSKVVPPCRGLLDSVTSFYGMSKAMGLLDYVPSGPPHVKCCGCTGFCAQRSNTCQRLWVCWILPPVVHNMSKAGFGAQLSNTCHYIGILDSVPSGLRHVKGYDVPPCLWHSQV